VLLVVDGVEQQVGELKFELLEVFGLETYGPVLRDQLFVLGEVVEQEAEEVFGPVPLEPVAVLVADAVVDVGQARLLLHELHALLHLVVALLFSGLLNRVFELLVLQFVLQLLDYARVVQLEQSFA